MKDDIKLELSVKWLFGALVQLVLIGVAVAAGYGIARAQYQKRLDGISQNDQSQVMMLGEQDSGSNRAVRGDYGTKVVSTDKSQNSSISATKADSSAATGAFVASKTGTKFYPKGCKAVDAIKPENIVEFMTADEAVRAGYSESTKC